MITNLNLTALWGVVTSTALGVLWMFSTFASASEVQEIKYVLLKQEIRELRKDVEAIPDGRAKEILSEDLQVAIDALCRIAPQDRECRA